MNTPVTLAGRVPRLASDAPELAGRSPVISRVHELVRRAALGDGGVLITGDPGTDAEAVARRLHERSQRARGPFLAVDCGAEHAGRIESLLFGAPVVVPGPPGFESISGDSLLAQARGGTLFLQHVGDLPASAQARLARVVRDGEVWLNGAAVPAAFRLVAASHAGLDADVASHRFRSDLYRRITTARVDLPSLGDRQEDVPAIVLRLLSEASARLGEPPRGATQAALALLGAISWPGNLAELRAVVERVVRETTDDPIQVEQLLPALPLDRRPAPLVPTATLREARLRFERDYISAVLQHHGWRMAAAAQTLGIQRPNLYRKARQLGIPLGRLSD
jgi:DNA-binding NtrC family response regulator